MVKTSDFESENSGSSPDEAAIVRAERAFCKAIGKDYDGYRGYYRAAIEAALMAAAHK